uniref:Uncharacterized protein n=1 Tax=Anguilla anguilla TaxID=7936 RepID=A0A0E9V3Z7_ANGAN
MQSKSNIFSHTHSTVCVHKLKFSRSNMHTISH